MTTIYHIDLTDNLISFQHEKAPKVANQYHAPNARQYFAKRGRAKPEPVTVRGWPFKKIFLVNGTEENGHAVAWA